MNEPAVQIVISMTSTGQVSVTGPLEQRVLCYGLLEMARDVIRDYQVPAGKLQLATGPVARV